MMLRINDITAIVDVKVFIFRISGEHIHTNLSVYILDILSIERSDRFECYISQLLIRFVFHDNFLFLHTIWLQDQTISFSVHRYFDMQILHTPSLGSPFSCLLDTIRIKHTDARQS